VQAGAGKTRGPIESLLVEHRQIRQNARALGKIAFGVPPSGGLQVNRNQGDAFVQ
jgi:hypothetical protein